MRKDAYLPSDKDVKLPSDVTDDELLCKLLDNEDSESIFPFIEFTGLNIMTEELYGMYGKVIDESNGNIIGYKQLLKTIIDELWNLMVNDKIKFNAKSVINKIGDVIDLKSAIVKELYDGVL